MTIKTNFSKNYIFLLCIFAFSLSISKFLVSLTFILLIVNWIFEGKLKEKWKSIIKSTPLKIFLIIYLTHLVGLTYTNNFNYAFHDLNIKLPLLILPVIVYTSRPLSTNQTKYVLLSLLAGSFLASLISLLTIANFIDANIFSSKDISILISHIRFSLFILFAVFSSLYMISDSNYNFNKTEKIVILIIVIWLSLYLFILKSLTGIVLFFVLLLIFGIHFINQLNSNIRTKWLLRASLLMIIIFPVVYFIHCLNLFFNFEEIDYRKLPGYTVNGNPYIHTTISKRVENGYYLTLYVCEKELKREWNTISELNYESEDNRGNEIKYTLMRYLTSKGLKKDSAGIHQLSDQDIQNIENGYGNYIYTRKFSLYPYIYGIIWEFYDYYIGNQPDGHSITQRTTFLKAGLTIFKNNWLIGVGTGDVADAFQEQYNSNYSETDKRFQHRAHNQYLTFLISFGLIGFIVIFSSLIIPLILKKQNLKFLTTMFLLIVFLSFLNEDTLETHVGVNFFAIFYSLFIFGTNKK